MNTIFILLRPRLLSFFNNYRLGKNNKSWIRLFMFGSVGAVFWVGSFIMFYRVLLYFQSVQDFGDILAMKLLSMIIITFFALLLFSSIINSLSHFYLSRDLPLLHSLPVEARTIFMSRFLLSVFDSSWMVVAFSLPVFLSYDIYRDNRDVSDCNSNQQHCRHGWSNRLACRKNPDTFRHSGSWFSHTSYSCAAYDQAGTIGQSGQFCLSCNLFEFAANFQLFITADNMDNRYNYISDER
jgi:hypothetical protein